MVPSGVCDTEKEVKASLLNRVVNGEVDPLRITNVYGTVSS